MDWEFGIVVLSHLSHVQLFATLWTVACQAPLSMGCSRQEYWSGLPCPSLGDLPHPGIQALVSCIAGEFFTAETQRSLGNTTACIYWENPCVNIYGPV